MSERFDLAHIESCMGGNLKSPLFDLEQYGQRMKVSRQSGIRRLLRWVCRCASAVWHATKNMPGVQLKAIAADRPLPLSACAVSVCMCGYRWRTRLLLAHCAWLRFGAAVAAWAATCQTQAHTRAMAGTLPWSCKLRCSA